MLARRSSLEEYYVRHYLNGLITEIVSIYNPNYGRKEELSVKDRVTAKAIIEAVYLQNLPFCKERIEELKVYENKLFIRLEEIA